MGRVKFTTTINQDLLERAKEKALAEGTGVNAVIEKALKVYFANCTVSVWEKYQRGGWLQKLIIRPDKVTLEHIRSRRVTQKYDNKNLEPTVLEAKGWHQTWRMKQVSN